MPGPLHILILGGTSEARQLAERLAGDPNVAPILSLAGRTRNPVLPSIAHRIGGFGGTAAGGASGRGGASSFGGTIVGGAGGAVGTNFGGSSGNRGDAGGGGGAA